MAILKLKPSGKDYIWGGHKLVDNYGKEMTGDRLAETWELSCHPDGPSFVDNGEDAGKTLRQYIEEHGNGGSIIAKDNYFFIDNSFVRCMYEYGAIVFVLVIVLIFMAQKKMLDNEKYIMCLAFFIVTIASFAEHHLLEIAYNPFIFSVFACMSNNDKVIMEEKRIC